LLGKNTVETSAAPERTEEASENTEASDTEEAA
jgi:hypothetical protein